MDAQRPSPLEYAPPPRWYRSARVRRRATWAAVLLLLGAAALWTPRIVRHLRILYWQRQCLNHAAPPGQIVFDSTDSATSMKADASSFVSMAGASPPVAMRIARPWKELCSLLMPGHQPGATVFLGRRRSAADREWLVAAELRQSGGRAELEVNSIEPGSLLRGPRVVLLPWTSGSPAFTGFGPAGPAWQVATAQVDAAAGRDFTIRLLAGEQTWSAVCRLNDDGSVHVKLSMAATRP